MNTVVKALHKTINIDEMPKNFGYSQFYCLLLQVEPKLLLKT